jgi:hypothetical protein
MHNPLRSRVAVLIAVLFINGAQPAVSQGSAGSEGGLEPRWLVDIPTAGMLAKGTFAFDLDFYQEGGVLLGFTAGVIDRLSIGLSYGGSRIIGSQSPIMNSYPGVAIRIRIIEENFVLPAIAVGFDTQGKEGYLKDRKRYLIKSPGLYAVVSKNYKLLGYLSLHGGANYSLEQSDNSNVNVFFGVEKTAGPFLSLIMEYNLARNDPDGSGVGRGRGYLNAAIKCSLGSGLTLGFALKDMLRNAGDVSVGTRTVSVEYVNFF